MKGTKRKSLKISSCIIITVQIGSFISINVAALFIMEVAPPQYVTVMRHRTSKMLDTITEEDQREMLDYHSLNSSSSSPSSPSSLFPAKASSSLFPAKASSSTSASSSSVSIPSADSKYFLKEVHRSLSNLNH